MSNKKNPKPMTDAELSQLGKRIVGILDDRLLDDVLDVLQSVVGHALSGEPDDDLRHARFGKFTHNVALIVDAYVGGGLAPPVEEVEIRTQNPYRLGRQNQRI